MGEERKKVLAMYDVRGIQNYIFRTAKVKDAIGASAIVEDVIEKAIEDACKKEKRCCISAEATHMCYTSPKNLR